MQAERAEQQGEGVQREPEAREEDEVVAREQPHLAGLEGERLLPRAPAHVQVGQEESDPFSLRDPGARAGAKAVEAVRQVPSFLTSPAWPTR